MNWTEADKQRVRGYFKKILVSMSQAELARQMMGPNAVRQAVPQCIKLGQVPVTHHENFIRIAATIGLKVTPAQLHPHAKEVMAMLKRTSASKRAH